MYYKNLDEEKVVSVYFKYYRQNLYFEKAIRYDEIYFSSNEELNDPLDLSFTPYFDDNEVAWEKLLQVKPKVEMLNIALYLDTTSYELASELNSIFKGSTLAYQQTIKPLIDSKNKELKRIFIKHINNAIESEYTSDKNSNFSNFDTEAKAEMCISFLTEILSRGWSKKFYSCSFSKNALEPKMWAHYADGFKGCVIIYESNENSSIKLKPHFRSTKYESYNFSEVQYSDIEKKVSILDYMLKSSIVNSPLLTKNSFWSYEEEYRLLLSEEFNYFYLTQMDNMPITSSRERIFYHQEESIIGVIFGARCSKDYKDKVRVILGEKCSYKQKGFYSFDTELTTDGNVVIKSGSICRSMKEASSQVYDEILEGDRLNKCLIQLRISF